MSKNKAVDMTTGPFLKKMLAFAFPLMLTGVLQLVYNAADSMVIGKFSGSASLAAVGSTGSLVNLIINLFIGFATGAGVVTAHHIGARDNERVSKCVHTSMALGIISGFSVCFIGFFFSGTFLKLMGSPPDVLPLATLYLKIYFLGAPASLVYNFGAAIVRANGDTKRPLYILAFSGMVNVILNLISVIVFKLDVAGVAIATITSQIISAILIVIRLVKLEDACRYYPKKTHIYKEELAFIAKIGVPAGIQGSLFSFSNVLIQSTINSFGSITMAGNTAAQNADGFIYTCTNAIAQTAMTFTSQNTGAKKPENLNKIYFRCLGLALGIGVLLGALELVFAEQIIGIFTNDKEVVAAGIERLRIMAATYFTCSLMDVSGGQIRGMGKSIQPMIITLLGACGIRIVWIYTVFKLNPTLNCLYLSYPISWVTTFIALCICYFVLKRGVAKNS